MYSAIRSGGAFTNTLGPAVSSFSANTVQPLGRAFSLAAGPPALIGYNQHLGDIGELFSGSSVNGVPSLQQVLSGGQDIGSGIANASRSFRIPSLASHGQNLVNEMPRVLSYASNEKEFRKNIQNDPQNETNDCLFDNPFGDVMGSLISAGKQIFDGIYDTLSPIINGIKDAIVSAAGWVIDAAGRVRDAIGRVVGFVGQTIDQAMAFIASNIERAVSAIRGAVGALASAINDAVRTVTAAINSVVEAVRKEIAALAELVGESINKALASLLALTDDPCVSALVNNAGSVASKTAFAKRLPVSL